MRPTASMLVLLDRGDVGGSWVSASRRFGAEDSPRSTAPRLKNEHRRGRPHGRPVADRARPAAPVGERGRVQVAPVDPGAVADHRHRHPCTTALPQLIELRPGAIDRPHPQHRRPGPARAPLIGAGAGKPALAPLGIGLRTANRPASRQPRLPEGPALVRLASTNGAPAARRHRGLCRPTRKAGLLGRGLVLAVASPARAGG